MQQSTQFLIGKLVNGSERWAAFDGSFHYHESRIGERRFEAYLAPYRDEDSARKALTAAGAVSVEAEQGQRDRKRRGR